MTDENRVVVVGSGPAGAMAALQLLRAGVDVTLLEAGTADAARGLTVRVGGLTVIRIHRSLPPRSEGVTATGDPNTLLYDELSPGGLSNHWSCAVPRFSPDDFLDARQAGEAFEWPVDYDELTGWYDRVEPLLAIAGTTADVPQLKAGKVRRALELDKSWTRVVEAAKREGQGIAPIPYTYGSGTTATRSGTVFNSFVRLIRPEVHSRHLHVSFGARVTRLEWSGRSKRVNAVVYRDAKTGSDHRLSCRAVVLAAGAINTAKLLLQSTDGDFPEGLGNTHGVLGRYLHDHPLGKVEIALSTPLGFHPPGYVTRSPVERSHPLYAASCLQWGGVRPFARSLLSRHPGQHRFTGFNVFGTMAPVETNFVALDDTHRSTDGTPGLFLHVHHPAESERTLVAARDRLVGLFDTAGFQPQLQKWLIEPVGKSVHYAGTCRMHASPRFGMLDCWNRLHAVPNVVVADSAAFTTGPEKNPVLTAMALAARASARLADDLRAGVI